MGKPHKPGAPAIDGEQLAPGLLAITSDERLYYLLLSAAIDLHWKIVWARTVGRACELYRSQPMPLVVFDEHLPGVDWREALADISGFPGPPRIVFAASEVNQEIWETVLQLSGYDAVRRSSGSEDWRRELQFAWLSRKALMQNRRGNQVSAVFNPTF